MLVRFYLLFYFTLIQSKFIDIHPEILQTYTDYELIIHFDNETYFELNGVFKTYLPKTLYNYDRINNQLKRPSGLQFVHIVYLSKPRQFRKYSKNVINLKYKDVIIILMSNNTMIAREKVQELPGLERAGSVIVKNIERDDYYYAKYFYGNKSKVLQKIEQSSLKLIDYRNDFKNFNQHVFKIGFLQNPPYIFRR